ncbi:MAG: DUF4124 domain-containing protein [Pseudomonadota bacterium]
MTPRFVTRLVVVALVALPSAASAQIYSCPAPDGSVTYRQTPCPEAPQAAAEAPEVPEDGDDPGDASDADCEAAGRLGFATARLMHGGLSAAETLDEFGGAALPAGARRLVTAVFDFRDDPDLGAERIGALAETMCRSGSFANLSCETLPAGNARSAAGCAGAAESRQASRQPRTVASPKEDLTDERRRAIRACREPIEAQIEAIDVELRRGIRGDAAERRLDELLSLTDALRACAR